MRLSLDFGPGQDIPAPRSAASGFWHARKCRFRRGLRWSRRESNPRPLACHAPPIKSVTPLAICGSAAHTPRRGAGVRPMIVAAKELFRPRTGAVPASGASVRSQVLMRYGEAGHAKLSHRCSASSGFPLRIRLLAELFQSPQRVEHANLVDVGYGVGHDNERRAATDGRGSPARLVRAGLRLPRARYEPSRWEARATRIYRGLQLSSGRSAARRAEAPCRR